MRRSIILIVLLVFSSLTHAKIWTIGTAEVMQPQAFETGVFSPLRYGLDETTELTTHPVFDFILPNVSIKKQWFKQNNNSFASEHTLSYPSWFLKTISRKGTGGVLPANTKVPQLLTINNDFYFTHKVRDNLWLTPQFSIEHTLNASMNAMPTLAYQRTASYHDGTIFRVGFDMDGSYGNHLSYTLDIDYYYLPRMDGNYAWEHKALLRYSFGKMFSTLIGYKYINAAYPFGKESRFFPLLDLLWNWN